MNNKYHKTIITLEVISDYLVSVDSLEDVGSVAEQCISGDFSGKIKDVQAIEMTPSQTADALREQGSDPGFILGTYGWIYDLSDGDEVTVFPRTKTARGVTISGDVEIQDHPDDDDESVVRFMTKDGEHIEARFDEIS